MINISISFKRIMNITERTVNLDKVFSRYELETLLVQDCSVIYLAKVIVSLFMALSL